MTEAHTTGSIPAHGGQLSRISRQFGIPESELLDFSTNLNPNGPPPGVFHALSDASTRPEVIRDYPNLELLDLRLALASYAGVEAENIVRFLVARQDDARAISIRSPTSLGWRRIRFTGHAAKKTVPTTIPTVRMPPVNSSQHPVELSLCKSRSPISMLFPMSRTG